MKTELKAMYVVVSGSSSARIVPDLLQDLAQFGLPIYTLLTTAAHQVISPYNLADQEGHTLVTSYFDPILLYDRVPGLTLVVPTTFNTLNKLSQGIADTLPHSLVAEAIGAGWPVIVVPSMNILLANHPRVPESIATLRRWGVTVLESGTEHGLSMMASETEILKAVRAALGLEQEQTQ